MGKEAVKLFDFSSTFMGGKLTQGMLISEIYDDLYGDQNNSEETKFRDKQDLTEKIFKVKKYEKKMKSTEDTKNKITFANKVSELFCLGFISLEKEGLFKKFQIIKFLYEFNAKNNEVDIISIFDSPYSNDNKYFNVVIDELITIVDKEDNQFFKNASDNNLVIYYCMEWAAKASSNIVYKSENYEKITNPKRLAMIDFLHTLLESLKGTLCCASKDCKSKLTVAQWTMDRILKISAIIDLEQDLKVQKAAWQLIKSIKPPSAITLDKVKKQEKYSINDEKNFMGMEESRQFLFPNKKMDKRKIKRAIPYVEVFEKIFNSVTQGKLNENHTKSYRDLGYLRQYLCLEKKKMENGKVHFQTFLRKIVKLIRENKNSTETEIKEHAYILANYIIFSGIQYQNGGNDEVEKYYAITQELIYIRIELYRKIWSDEELRLFYCSNMMDKRMFEKHIKENLDYQEKINARCDYYMNVRHTEYKRIEEDKNKKD